VPEDEARAVLAGDRYTAEVRDDEQLGAQLGIRGVPFFVLGRRYGVSGAQSADVLAGALEQAWDEASARAA
jgi:predicted DsbA family dithiol-disulfide isomerase